MKVPGTRLAVILVVAVLTAAALVSSPASATRTTPRDTDVLCVADTLVNRLIIVIGETVNLEYGCGALVSESRFEYAATCGERPDACDTFVDSGSEIITILDFRDLPIYTTWDKAAEALHSDCIFAASFVRSGVLVGDKCKFEKAPV